jgi:hypothetical protein
MWIDPKKGIIIGRKPGEIGLSEAVDPEREFFVR